MKRFTVATRGGRLAIAQAESVISALKKIYPDVEIGIKKITTKGDIDKRTALWDIESSGFFTSRVEDSLLAGEADFAVHSFKDLPTKEREGLIIAAVCGREFPEDCVLANGAVTSIDRLRPSAKIGTSSLRRAVQIKRLREDVQTVPIRGNVPTRIRFLEEGKFDAIVLARAGLERLGMGEKISFCFEPGRFIPAPAQGAMAVQVREDDAATAELVAAINDKQTRLVTFAERQILATTQCGCHAPVGAFAKITGSDIIINTFISDVEGEIFIERQITGPAAESQRLAEKVAYELLDAGGREVLEKLEK